MLKKKKAQSVQEYAILIALVAAALIAMQVYVKRGIQGRLRGLADQVSPKQYEYDLTTSSTSISRSSSSTESDWHGTYTSSGSEQSSSSSSQQTIDR